MTRSETDVLHAMAWRYCWDAENAISVETARVVRRVMDLGVIKDELALEQVFGRRRLADVLTTSPAGAMRPRSCWFWHYRLGLADADHDPPPLPMRRFGAGVF